MNIEIFLKNYAAKIIGVSMIVCNLFLLICIINLFYEYNFTNKLFCIMVSDITLFLSSILFSTGIATGFFIFKEKISYLKWSLIDLGLVILAFVIEYLDTM